MPKHTVNWVNDHTQICDRLDARVQLMEDYLDGKPDDFDGIAVKRFLLSQAREQISWYRQSIDALNFVGCVACRRALETGQSFLEHYLPAYNFREAERGTEYKRMLNFRSYPRCGHGSMMRGISMLVKLQTTKFLIYAELDKTERVTHLASKNRIRPRTCYTILHEIEQRGDFQVTWGFADDGYSDTVRISRAKPKR